MLDKKLTLLPMEILKLGYKQVIILELKEIEKLKKQIGKVAVKWNRKGSIHIEDPSYLGTSYCGLNFDEHCLTVINIAEIDNPFCEKCLRSSGISHNEIKTLKEVKT